MRRRYVAMWALCGLLASCADVGVAPDTFLAKQESETNCPLEFDEDQCIVWDAAVAYAESLLSTPGIRAGCSDTLDAFWHIGYPEMTVIDNSGTSASYPPAVISWGPGSTVNWFRFDLDFFEQFTFNGNLLPNTHEYLANLFFHEGRHFLSGGTASESEAYEWGDDCSGVEWS